MLYIISGLILIGFLIKFFSGKNITRLKPKINCFGFNVFYSDTRSDKIEKNVIYSKLLYSKKYDITGKPDYILKSKFLNAMIPIELKSGKIKVDNEPHKGDLMQLVAYFLIIEDEYKIRPKYGKIIYSDFMFKIKNTKKLRNELKETLANMRNMLKSGSGCPNSSFVNCRYCICNGTVCEENGA